MLIHPADEEPGVLIGFREEVAFPIDDDPRARISIEVVGLNREELAEFRLDHLMPFKLLLQALPLLPADSAEVRDIQALFEQAVASESSVLPA